MPEAAGHCRSSWAIVTPAPAERTSSRGAAAATGGAAPRWASATHPTAAASTATEAATSQPRRRGAGWAATGRTVGAGSSSVRASDCRSFSRLALLAEVGQGRVDVGGVEEAVEVGFVIQQQRTQAAAFAGAQQGVEIGLDEALQLAEVAEVVAVAGHSATPCGTCNRRLYARCVHWASARMRDRMTCTLPAVRPSRAAMASTGSDSA